MSKPLTPPTADERNAPKAVDLYKGMDCGRFDPEKSDHIHGRSGAPSLLFSAGKGFDTRAFCPVHGRRWVWCKHLHENAAAPAGPVVMVSTGGKLLDPETEAALMDMAKAAVRAWGESC